VSWRDPMAQASEDEEMGIRDGQLVSRDLSPVRHMLLDVGKVIGQLCRCRVFH
jgi:hypothetical protein